VKPALSGRADLIRVLALGDTELAQRAAELLGYHEMPTLAPPPPRRFVEPLPQPQGQEPTTYAPADVPFWRLERYEAVSLDQRPPEFVAVPVPYQGWRGRPAVMPGFTPLASKQTILTRLRQSAAMRRTARDIDVEKVVDRICRGTLLYDIPRRERRVWGSELHIIQDRARRLVPYWRDQADITSMLYDL
jgi:hypothetical protein